MTNSSGPPNNSKRPKIIATIILLLAALTYFVDGAAIEVKATDGAAPNADGAASIDRDKRRVEEVSKDAEEAERSKRHGSHPGPRYVPSNFWGADKKKRSSSSSSSSSDSSSPSGSSSAESSGGGGDSSSSTSEQSASCEFDDANPDVSCGHRKIYQDEFMRGHRHPEDSRGDPDNLIRAQLYGKRTKSEAGKPSVVIVGGGRRYTVKRDLSAKHVRAHPGDALSERNK